MLRKLFLSCLYVVYPWFYLFFNKIKYKIIKKLSYQNWVRQITRRNRPQKKAQKMDPFIHILRSNIKTLKWKLNKYMQKTWWRPLCVLCFFLQCLWVLMTFAFDLEGLALWVSLVYSGSHTLSTSSSIGYPEL